MGSTAVASRPHPPDPVRRSAARVATLVSVPVALLIAIGSLWVFGGFSLFSHPSSEPSARPQVTSLVTLPAPALAEPASGVCREVIAKLPASLAGSARRPVTGPEQNAAYGDPPVTVACGVAPVAVAATEDVIQLNGVCWVNRPAPSGGTWFTVDRAVPVGVSVPGPTAGSAQRVIGLTGSIKANDPVAAHFPSGCAG